MAVSYKSTDSAQQNGETKQKNARLKFSGIVPFVATPIKGRFFVFSQ